MFALVFQRIIIDFFLDILYFPVWWFSGGIKHAFFFALDVLKSGNSMLAPGLWLQNLFVPMFGQTDWQGRLMSVFMRFINVIFRSILLGIWLVVCFIVFLTWIAIPLFLLYMIILSLS